MNVHYARWYPHRDTQAQTTTTAAATTPERYNLKLGDYWASFDFEVVGFKVNKP